MKGKRHLVSIGLLVVLASSLLSGCVSDATPTPVAGNTDTNTSGGTDTGYAAKCNPENKSDKLTLQLKWLHQAQFAGYYVAADKGYYKYCGLDLTILPGGPDVVPSQKVETGAADIGIDWVGSLLANRDKGKPLVDIFQTYQSSGLFLISKKKSGINSPADLKGKKVGVWTGGNEFEFRALMDKYKFDNSIDNNKDMTVIKQGYEMESFLNDQLDAASAMVYNEYNVVLEAGVKPDELNIIKYNDEGVGMLEDHAFVTEQTMKDKKDALIRFLAASQRGWIDAIKDESTGVESTMSRVDMSTTNRDHQKSMMREIAKLVAPAGSDSSRVGFIDPAAFQTTADIALKFNVISQPAKDAYSNELMEAAAALNK